MLSISRTFAFFLLTFYLISSIPRERAQRVWRSHLSEGRDPDSSGARHYEKKGKPKT